VLQSGLHIEIAEVISDPDRVGICEPLKCLLDHSLLGISLPHNSGKVKPASTLLPVLSQEISGFSFLCSYKPVPALGSTRTASEQGHLCQIFSLIDVPEL
jgi:hypothetical protein